MKEHKILHSGSVKGLDEIINDHLARGYVLSGDLAIDETGYFRPVILITDEDGDEGGGEDEFAWIKKYAWPYPEFPREDMITVTEYVVAWDEIILKVDLGERANNEQKAIRPRLPKTQLERNKVTFTRGQKLYGFKMGLQAGSQIDGGAYKIVFGDLDGQYKYYFADAKQIKPVRDIGTVE